MRIPSPRALGCLLAAALALGARPDDEEEVRRQVARLFDAVEKKDLDGALALWSTVSPQRGSFRDVAAARREPLAELQVARCAMEADRAVVTLRFKGRWGPEDDGFPDEQIRTWRVELRREGGTWKWYSREPAALELARRLAAEAGKDSRARLLREYSGLVGSRLLSALNEEAVGRAEAGDGAAAERRLDAAEEVATLLGDQALLGDTLTVRGIVLVVLSRPGEAAPPLRRGAELAEKAGGGDDEAVARAYLGLALADSGKPDAAAQEAARALQAARSETILALAENFNGFVLRARGDLAGARGWFEKSLDRAERGGLKDARVQALHGLGLVHHELGDQGEAARRTREGLDLLGEGELPALRAKLFNTQGLIHLALRERREALERFEESFKIWHGMRNMRMVGVLFNNIGETHRQSRAWKDAEVYLVAGLKFLDPAGQVAEVTAARNNLGIVYRELGREDLAREQYDLSLKNAESRGDEAGRVMPLCNIGELQAARGEFPEALGTFEKALGIARKVGSSTQLFFCHLGIGAARAHRGGRGDLEEAAEAFGRAMSCVERTRAGLRDPAMRQGFFEGGAPVSFLLADVFRRLDRPAEAFAAAERAKARTLVDALEAGRVDVVKSMTDDERRQEEFLEAQVAGFDRRLETARLTDDRIAARDGLDKAREALGEFQRAVFQRHPDLRTLRARFDPATPAEVAAGLFKETPGPAVLSYLVGKNETLLFVLTPGAGVPSLTVHRIPVKASDLRDRTADFWARCATPVGEWRGEAQALYRTLLAPAEAELAGRTHLVIAPDDVLHGLPFAALVDAEGKTVAEKRGVSLTPSVTALTKMAGLADRRRREPAGPVPLAAFGAPAMPPGFSDLERAKAEVEALAGAYGVPAATGEAATEARAKAEMGKARRIHLATHGKLDEASPMYSFLVLARGGGEDGYLRAREIARLDLRAELAVLSACETARGREVPGEGLVGLTWAFFVAGAPSTVASLWQVADESTSRLMGAFYERLRSGATKASALRDAQLRLLGEPGTAHPYFWAPFILTGDWRE